MYDPSHPDNIADQIMIYALVSHLVYGQASRRDLQLCRYSIDETHPFVKVQHENSVHPSARPIVIRTAGLIVSRMVSILGASSVSVPYFIDPEDSHERPHNNVARDVLTSAVIAAYTYAQRCRGEDAHRALEQVVEAMDNTKIAVDVEERSGIPAFAALSPEPDDFYCMKLSFHLIPKNVSG